jgi:hypothetical protein
MDGYRVNRALNVKVAIRSVVSQTIWLCCMGLMGVELAATA